MDGLGENLKKVLLAGVGAVAVTAEKSKDLLDEMVKKGEITVEYEGKGQCLHQTVVSGGTSGTGRKDDAGTAC